MHARTEGLTKASAAIDELAEGTKRADEFARIFRGVLDDHLRRINRSKPSPYELSIGFMAQQC
jgi:hypothetical protein